MDDINKVFFECFDFSKVHSDAASYLFIKITKEVRITRLICSVGNRGGKSKVKKQGCQN